MKSSKSIKARNITSLCIDREWETDASNDMFGMSKFVDHMATYDVAHPVRL